MVRALFIMEQQVGHHTFYQNLRPFVDADSRLAASWAEITYYEAGGLWERLNFLPGTLRGTLRGRAQTRAALAGLPHDVTFYNTQVPDALGGALARRRPYVLCTDITPMQYDRMGIYGHVADRPGPLKAYKHRVNVAAFRQAARVIAWSSWARDSMIADYGVAPAQVETLPPGVDLEMWKPGPAHPSHGVNILFVGGDLQRKGGDALLVAFRALRRQSAAPAELHLVTRTPVPREAGVHVYLDMQPNSPALIALYQQADLFVLPTRGEAFGIVAVEASAAGLPSIVSRMGGLTDIVAEGETGFLIEPGDVEALTERLRLLVEDAGLRRRMGLAARARAERRFDARQNARRIADILLEVGN
jgi:glycosyltransferase involved in cell wall biosynthesis